MESIYPVSRETGTDFPSLTERAKAMAINPWMTNSFLDSCAFDAKYDPEHKAAAEIFRLHRDENLGIIVAHSKHKEAEHPDIPGWAKAAAAAPAYADDVALTQGERDQIYTIHAMLGGSDDQDARYVYEAQKYGSYFVTTDQRMIKKAIALRQFCQVQILLPSQFLALVGKYHRPP